jgi:phosphatidate cytidylyltransferase
VLGLVLPPVIGVGDLAESALKRALGIKDSSSLVPGHGGIADRLDSLLFAAPAVYYYVKWIVL